jgi:glycosyltransferase involved in cell wall biosynthesis
MSKVKIVFLVNDLGLSGTARVVMDLCSLSTDTEYDISVISLTKNIPLANIGGWPNNVEVYTFEYYYEPNYSLKRYIELAVNKKITKTRAQPIIDMIDKLNPDILHCHLQPRELIIANLANRRKNYKLLFTDHSVRISHNESTYIKRLLLARVYKYILHDFHITGVSASVMDCHINFGLINKKNIHRLIENKIDVNHFIPDFNKQNNPLNIVYVARLSSGKGHHLLLESWAQLEGDHRPQLYFVGGGDLEMTLRNQISELNLEECITFIGEIEDVVPYLQMADIGVFPSYREGLPLALLEKMSCGLPVLGSDIPELKRVINDGENGLLFRSGSVTDLVMKLKMLIKDDELRNSLGTKAREFVMQRYDSKKVKAEYKEVYIKLMSLSK